MSGKNKKQFGVWMDSHHAIIIGRETSEDKDPIILARVENPGAEKNTSEYAAHQQESALTHKFFKEIAATMVNIDEIHVTGTGQAQEQFIHFLAETPQYKNAVSSESTSNKMHDDDLLTFMSPYFK
jgi:hypothetical protein